MAIKAPSNFSEMVNHHFKLCRIIFAIYIGSRNFLDYRKTTIKIKSWKQTEKDVFKTDKFFLDNLIFQIFKTRIVSINYGVNNTETKLSFSRKMLIYFKKMPSPLHFLVFILYFCNWHLGWFIFINVVVCEDEKWKPPTSLMSSFKIWFPDTGWPTSHYIAELI